MVAIVVCHDPGDWFEETLAALGQQTYPALSVLVIDTASEHDPTPRIAAVLPDAHVHRLDHDPGFGAAVNQGAELVEGAAFYVLCHDDIAPEPDAVRYRTPALRLTIPTPEPIVAYARLTTTSSSLLMPHLFEPAEFVQEKTLDYALHGLLFGGLLLVDLVLFSSATLKLFQGGWLPLLVGAAIAISMLTWRKGRRALFRRLYDNRMPLESFVEQLREKPVPRVVNTAVFLTRNPTFVPLALLHNYKHNHVLHERIAVLNPIPSRPPSNALAGTRQSSKMTSAVCEPRNPIFL